LFDLFRLSVISDYWTRKQFVHNISVHDGLHSHNVAFFYKKKMENNMEGQEEEKDKNTSPELLKTFVTKQTPVFRVRFTRRNLLLAGGPFKQENKEES